MNQKGTIYLRNNDWYKIKNVLKMGISSFAKDRNNTYITGEVTRGEYIYVIEIPLDKMILLDKCLKSYFKELNIYEGGGTEFYDPCIINLIENYLQKTNIEYKILTKEEINLINRYEKLRNILNFNKIQNIFNKLNIKSIIQKYKDKKANLLLINNEIKPSYHQQYILNMIEDFYISNNIGKIIWACGLGKALLSILIIKLLKVKSIIFGVPCNNLQKQLKKEIMKIFPNKNNILFVGGDGIIDINSTTNTTKIIHFLNNNINNEPKFVICTYHSCHLVVNENINVDFKIGDEAHHLVGGDNDITKHSFL